MGARFEARDDSVITAPSLSSCILFSILTLQSEQCFALIETIFLMHTTFIHTFNFREKEKKNTILKIIERKKTASDQSTYSEGHLYILTKQIWYPQGQKSRVKRPVLS